MGANMPQSITDILSSSSDNDISRYYTPQPVDLGFNFRLLSQPKPSSTVNQYPTQDLPAVFTRKEPTGPQPTFQGQYGTFQPYTIDSPELNSPTPPKEIPKRPWETELAYRTRKALRQDIWDQIRSARTPGEKQFLLDFWNFREAIAFGAPSDVSRQYMKRLIDDRMIPYIDDEGEKRYRIMHPTPQTPRTFGGSAQPIPTVPLPGARRSGTPRPPQDYWV